MSLESLVWVASLVLAPAPSEPSDAASVELDSPRADAGEERSEGPDGGGEDEANEELEGVEDISKVELADLLGMDLGEQLGTTEAVSANDEEVLRAPATLTILDAQMIRHMGANDFPELLRGIPGVQVIRSSNGNYLVSLRGAGGVTGNNVVVMLDGIPLNATVDGAVDWDLIPIGVQEVERVELVRGPVSAIYGADAYTGVINIVSRETAFARHSANLRGMGGVDLGLAAMGAGAGSYVYSGERVTFKWFGNGAYDNTNNRSGDTQQVPGMRVGSLAILRVETGEHSAFSAELGGAWSRRSSLEQLSLESQPIDRGVGFGRIGWRVDELPGRIESVELWASSRGQGIGAEPGSISGFNYADTQAVHSMVGLDMYFDLHEKFEARLGGEGSLDWVKAPYLHPAVSGLPRGGMAAFAGLSAFPVDTLDLNLHARVDLPPVTGRAAVSARSSVVYHRDRWALRLAFGTAFRSPTYVEAGGQFRDPLTNLILLEGNPDLRMPRSHSLELGATLSPKTGLRIRPVIYASVLERMIVEDFESLIRKTFAVTGSPRWLLGGELELDWDIIDALSLRASGGYFQFLREDFELVPVAGEPAQNSRWTAALRLYGSTVSERIGYGIGGSFSSPRSYDTRVGIPPVLLDTSVPHTGYLDASFEAQPGRAVPLWLTAKLRSGLMPGVSESPFVTGAQLGTVFMLGLQWRRE